MPVYCSTSTVHPIFPADDQRLPLHPCPLACRRLRAHKTGFRQIRIGLGQAIEQALYRQPVRIAGKRPHETHQGLAGARRIGRHVEREAARQFLNAPAR